MSGYGLCAAVALSVVFIVATGSKVRSVNAFEAFADGLAQFGIDSPRARRMAAAGVVVAELVGIAALLTPGHGSIVRLAPSAVLLAVFSVGLAAAGRRSPLVACHCFGSAAPAPVRPHLAVNAGLILLAVVGMVSSDGVVTSGVRVLAAGLGLIIGASAVTAIPVLEALLPQVGRPSPAAPARGV